MVTCSGITVLISSLVRIRHEVLREFWGGGSLDPLTQRLKRNKGEGDVVFCLFEVTARFYSHRPALLHHCNTASIQNELVKKKKKSFACCCFVLVDQTLILNFEAATCSGDARLHCMFFNMLVFWASNSNCASLQFFLVHSEQEDVFMYFFFNDNWNTFILMRCLFDIYSTNILMLTPWTSHTLKRLIYISLQGWLCSVIFEIELASSIAAVVSLPELQQERHFMQLGCLTVSIQLLPAQKTSCLYVDSPLRNCANNMISTWTTKRMFLELDDLVFLYLSVCYTVSWSSLSHLAERQSLSIFTISLFQVLYRAVTQISLIQFYIFIGSIIFQFGLWDGQMSPRGHYTSQWLLTYFRQGYWWIHC